jgi:hypothetical protein
MGMENSLHAMVVWCLIGRAPFVIQVRQGRTLFWGLTVALILNV